MGYSKSQGRPESGWWIRRGARELTTEFRLSGFRSAERRQASPPSIFWHAVHLPCLLFCLLSVLGPFSFFYCRFTEDSGRSGNNRGCLNPPFKIRHLPPPIFCYLLQLLSSLNGSYWGLVYAEVSNSHIHKLLCPVLINGCSHCIWPRVILWVYRDMEMFFVKKDLFIKLGKSDTHIGNYGVVSKMRFLAFAFGFVFCRQQSEGI